jgi:metal-responsive CopG/Arc/MetJ family transcriptional regulator
MKVQVMLNDNLVEKIDGYAKMMGISRSALCATFIGQGIMTYDKSFTIMNDMGDLYKKEIEKEAKK